MVLHPERWRVDPNERGVFRSGDHVVIVGRRWLAESGMVFSWTRCYVKILLFGGPAIKVHKKNVALIVEDAPSGSDGSVENNPVVEEVVAAATNYVSDGGGDDEDTE
jgi:hypothetical protein